MKFLTHVAFLALVLGVSEGACAGEWPTLRPFSKEVAIDLRSPFNLVQVDLADINGKPTYELVCFSGDYAAEEKIGDFIYGGGLLCGLGLKGIPVAQILSHQTLLSDDKTALHSRGAFDAQALAGPCATFPEFGSDRTFRLRNFELQLKVTDVEVFDGYEANSSFWKTFTNESRKDYPIGRAKLHIRVSPDSQAESAYSMPTRLANPRGNEEACAKQH